MYEDIIYEVDDPVATITLNRPDSLNAWSGNMDGEIRDALSRAEADKAVVGIVVTGAGRAFCAGADMKSLTALSSGDGDQAGNQAGDQAGDQDGAGSREERPTDGERPWWRTVDGDFNGRLTYPMAMQKPVIAAVNGAVAGMAYPFALSCDLRVGTPDSLFLSAFPQRGLIAEWGLSWLLPRLVGPSVALDLLMSSRRVTGEEAHSLGLLNYLVPADELLAFSRGYIEQLATTVSPASIAVMKRQVYQQMHRGLGEAEFESQELMVESFGRPDFREGVQSFVQKRQPEFPRIGE